MSLSGGMPLTSTADQYTDAATLILPGAESVTLHIANAAVYCQLGEPGSGGSGQPKWGGEEFIPLGSGSLDRPCDGIRFRSAAAGAAARVAATLVRRRS